MMRYIARRLAQMIPTVMGVLLITFVLFHVVGGSPARMKLGDRASAQALEEFDEQRGFNKPLLWGRRTATRAWTDAAYDRDAGAWSRIPETRHTPARAGERGFVTLPATGDWAVPLAFPLRADESYEWRFSWRRAGDASWTESVEILAGGVSPADLLRARADGTSLELSGLRLRRVVARPWDSQLWFYCPAAGAGWISAGPVRPTSRSSTSCAPASGRRWP
jgi:hypothetical protein